MPLAPASKLPDLLAEWQKRLQGWALDGSLTAAAQEALGLGGEPKALADLVAAWARGNFSGLPPVVLLSSADINGALGAYAISTGSIYLNADWLLSASQEQVNAVLTEELGHHLDGVLNAVDTPGDEGNLFAANTLKIELTREAKEAIQREDDSIFITVQGNQVEAEATIIRTEDFGIYQLAFSSAGTGGVYLRKRITEGSSTFAWESLVPAAGTFQTSNSIYSDLTTAQDGFIYVGITAQKDIFFDEPIVCKYSNNGSLIWSMRPEGANSLGYQYWARLFSVALGGDGYLYVRGETAKHFTTGVYLESGDTVAFLQRIAVSTGSILDTLYQSAASTFAIPPVGSTTNQAPVISLAVSPTAVSEDGTANLIYTFTRSGPTTSALNVNYTASGTATIVTDYTGIS
ncbi:hypothetical protein KBZ15_16050, partial [Cyanobium sp. BA20m-p-22]|nr:hypothetical protein [Cyanobium sp. BA20m-p-22]